MDATVSITGLDCSEEETLIGGRDDQTLPFTIEKQIITI